MALVKYGPSVVQMSGSIAGTVYARNRFGNYTRPRTKPVNPKSQRQTAIRTIMMFLSEQWRESPMTDAIRLAWQVYADSVNWQNRLGEQVTLTNFNMFIRGNAALLSAGGSLVTAAPVALGLPAGDPVFQVTDVSDALNSAKFTFDDTMDWCDEDGSEFIIYQGQPQPASHNFFGGPWRHWYQIGGSVGVPPVTPIGPIANPPWTLHEGQKIWWKARICRADARLSTEFRCDPTIVVA